MRLTKCGNLTVCEIYNLAVNLSGSWSVQRIGDLPAGYAPRGGRQVRQKVQVDNSDDTSSCAAWVNTSGTLYVANFGGTGLIGEHRVNCTMCWATE